MTLAQAQALALALALAVGLTPTLTLTLTLSSHRKEHIARRLRLEVEEQTRLAKLQKQVEQDFFAMACHEVRRPNPSPNATPNASLHDPNPNPMQVRNPLNGVVGSLRLAAPLLGQLSGRRKS